MANQTKQMQSWQFFHFARKHLGRSVLYAIFGKKNARTVDYWCEDPKYTGKETHAFDPIQGIKDLLDMLDDHGHAGVVRSCLSFLSPTDVDGIVSEVTELLPTMAEEKLADFRAVAEFQAAVDACASCSEVNALKLEAIAEIERTFAKYKEVCGK